MIKCERCGKELKSESGLLQHYKDKHPNEEPPKLPAKNEAPKHRKRRQSLRGRKSHTKFLLTIAVVAVIAIGVTLYVTYNRPSTTTGVGVGEYAPDFPITLANGTATSLSSYYGHPLLLWFIATWCPSCQEGTQLLSSQYYSRIRDAGGIILVVEDYDNLGQPGPSISQFADQYGGGSGKVGWFYGTATQGETYTYNPQAYLDLYYLLDGQGKIVETAPNLPNVLGSVADKIRQENNQASRFPFPCLGSEGTTIHIHPWLRIVINGKNITIPASIGIENCFEPLHTHDTSGIIHVESPSTNVHYTLGGFFAVWKDTYGYVTFDGSQHPIVFTSSNVLGFRGDQNHKIILLVDGRPSSDWGALDLNQLDYCSATSSAPPCFPTAVGNPYYNGQSYTFGTGHTIVIEYQAISG